MINRVVDINDLKTIDRIARDIMRNNSKYNKEQVKYTIYRYYKLKSGIQTK